jgi:hypothetical protein
MVISTGLGISHSVSMSFPWKHSSCFHTLSVHNVRIFLSITVVVFYLEFFRYRSILCALHYHTQPKTIRTPSLARERIASSSGAGWHELFSEE